MWSSVSCGGFGGLYVPLESVWFLTWGLKLSTWHELRGLLRLVLILGFCCASRGIEYHPQDRTLVHRWFFIPSKLGFHSLLSLDYESMSLLAVTAFSMRLFASILGFCGPVIRSLHNWLLCWSSSHWRMFSAFCLRSPWVLAMILGRVDKQHFSLASCANLAPLCGRVFRLSSTASVLMIFLCSQWLFTHPMVGCMPFSLVGKFVIFAGYLSFGGRLHSHSSTTLYYMYLFTLVCWVIH